VGSTGAGLVTGDEAGEDEIKLDACSVGLPVDSPLDDSSLVDSPLDDSPLDDSPLDDSAPAAPVPVGPALVHSPLDDSAADAFASFNADSTDLGRVLLFSSSFAST
jgi:hypothetical protein